MPDFKFSKWDIVYASWFPEAVKCNNRKCHGTFTIDKYDCPHCGNNNFFTKVIAKPRPIILWLDQDEWFKSMSFGIPLSKTNPAMSDRLNQSILLPHYVFLHKDVKYRQPMRAVISQATRVAGNTFGKQEVIGRITDEIIKEQIETKLFEWIF